jgi:hypothetical protein
MGRITDYESFHFCETCDAIYLDSMWDHDADMCVSCAQVTEDEDG